MSEPEYKTIADSLYDDAQRSLDMFGIDSFGSLIPSREALAWFTVKDVMRGTGIGNQMENFALNEYVDDRLKECDYLSFEIELEAEMLLAMAKTGMGRQDAHDRLKAREYMFETSYPVFGAHLKALELVYENPEYLPYVIAGITDVTLIKRCISEDVDAEMAVRL